MSATAESKKVITPVSTDGDGNSAQDSQFSADNGSIQQSDPGNVDKIREILFGGNMRDYDKRFSRLEERLTKESADLRAETKKLVDSLETFVKKEFEALSSRLESEQKSRNEAVQDVAQELRYTAKALDTKLAQFDTQTTQAQRDLREQILDQSKTLSEEIRQKNDEVATILDRRLKELNHEKTDRASLSALFTEVALRLNNDFKIPGDN